MEFNSIPNPTNQRFRFQIPQNHSIKLNAPLSFPTSLRVAYFVLSEFIKIQNLPLGQVKAKRFLRSRTLYPQNLQETSS